VLNWLSENYAMKMYGGHIYIYIYIERERERERDPRFLELSTSWRRLVRFTSRALHSTPGERVPGIHWIGGWVGPRASLGGVKKTFFTLLRLKLQPLGCTASSQSLYQLCWFYMTSLNNHRDKSTSINLYQKDDMAIITNCKVLP
jgi:hypothetical protein